MTRRQFDNFDDFSRAIRDARITHLVERVVREIRPRAGEGTAVIVDHAHFAEFLAYRDGVVLTCVVDGGARADHEQRLTEMGVQVKKVSGNIT